MVANFLETESREWVQPLRCNESSSGRLLKSSTTLRRTQELFARLSWISILSATFDENQKKRRKEASFEARGDNFAGGENQSSPVKRAQFPRGLAVDLAAAIRAGLASRNGTGLAWWMFQEKKARRKSFN